jgi:hypothetical protein
MKKLSVHKETLVSLNQTEAGHVVGAAVGTVTLPTTILPYCNPTHFNCPSAFCPTRRCTIFPGCPPPTSVLHCPTTAICV